MKNLILAIALLFSLNTFAQTEQVYTNIELAKEAAQKQNKKMFVLFTGSDWCPPCKQLEKRVLSQPTFQTYLNNNFVFLKLDFPRFRQQSKAQQEHNYKLLNTTNYNSRRVFPTIAIVNAKGEKTAEVDYYFQPKEELQEVLELLK